MAEGVMMRASEINMAFSAGRDDRALFLGLEAGSLAGPEEPLIALTWTRSSPWKVTLT